MQSAEQNKNDECVSTKWNRMERESQHLTKNLCDLFSRIKPSLLRPSLVQDNLGYG